MSDLLDHIANAPRWIYDGLYWPPSRIDWYHMVAILVTGIVKLRRGSNMKHRARRIDLFGWSIILFDLVFGAALVLGVLWGIFPNLKNEYADIVLTTAVLAVALLQTYTMEIASDHRVERAMAPHLPVREDGVPIAGDRRKGPRREADIAKDRELEELRAEVARYRRATDGRTAPL